MQAAAAAHQRPGPLDLVWLQDMFDGPYRMLATGTMCFVLAGFHVVMLVESPDFAGGDCNVPLDVWQLLEASLGLFSAMVLLCAAFRFAQQDQHGVHDVRAHRSPGFAVLVLALAVARVLLLLLGTALLFASSEGECTATGGGLWKLSVAYVATTWGMVVLWVVGALAHRQLVSDALVRGVDWEAGAPPPPSAGARSAGAPAELVALVERRARERSSKAQTAPHRVARKAAIVGLALHTLLALCSVQALCFFLAACYQPDSPVVPISVSNGVVPVVAIQLLFVLPLGIAGVVSQRTQLLSAYVFVSITFGITLLAIAFAALIEGTEGSSDYVDEQWRGMSSSERDLYSNDPSKVEDGFEEVMSVVGGFAFVESICIVFSGLAAAIMRCRASAAA